MSATRIPSNKDLFALACRLMPGGVNSPVRAFRAVGGEPLFMSSARGSRLVSQEGRSYIDYIGSWGPMILGHGFPAVVQAVTRQAQIGMSYGAPTELEVQMADLLVEMVPCLQQVRMVNSGTEACMSVIRVARAATGRELIVKFEGCYHGHADSFLSKAGSGMATLGEPTSPGVPAGAASATLNARFNDLASVEALFHVHGERIAGVIVEPVVGNMGCVAPEPGFLEGLRELCTEHGAALIFDEVMTGFRVSRGGAQELYGVVPDLCCLGKIIGGGLPVGAYGGAEQWMKVVAPLGAMYQAGTLSGNPLAMAAGVAQLNYLKLHPHVYTKLDEQGARLEAVVTEHARNSDYPVTYNRVGSMATLFFTRDKVKCWEDAATCNTPRYGAYFHHLLDNGVYMPPAQYEAFFHSAAHTDEEIEKTSQAMCNALDAVFA